jgi:hypothetical protein
VKRGRPAKPEARRTKRVALRLHPEELRQLRDKAAAAGETVAVYMRRACGLRLIDENDDPIGALLAELVE